MGRFTDDLLRKLQEGGEVDGHLVDVYYDELRRVASRRIHASIQRRVGASDVVMATIKSAISDLQNRRTSVTSSEEYEQMLKGYLKNKILATVRRESASCRDVRREIPLTESPDKVGSGGNEAEIRVFAAELDDYVEANFDERDKAIVRACFFQSWAARDIHDHWTTIVGEAEQISVRMIRVIIDKARRDIAKFYQE